MLRQWGNCHEDIMSPALAAALALFFTSCAPPRACCRPLPRPPRQLVRPPPVLKTRMTEQEMEAIMLGGAEP